MNFRVPIKHPERLKNPNPLFISSDPSKMLKLYRDDRLPNSIAGWMLTVSLRSALRAIYGSDLRAVLALFRIVLQDIFWDGRKATNVRIFLWRASRLFLREEPDYWVARGLDRKDVENSHRLDEL